MGSSASKYRPEITTEQLIRGIPLSVDAKFCYGVLGSKMVLTCSNSGREYLVRLPHGFDGVILFHDGPEKTFPVCMVMHNESLTWSRYSIVLPAIPREGKAPRVEYVMRSSKNVILDIYWFDLEVDRGNIRTYETFEWRKSHGEEVESLDVRRLGWKLVRIPMGDARYIAKRGERVDGFSSDGGEIVAVWGNKWGFHDKGHFELRGSGLKGELGQSFALMALASCIMIRINSKRRKARNNNAAAAGF